MDSIRIYCFSEGGTPIIELCAIAKLVCVRKLFVKDEGRNPTGTFKVRGAAVGVSRLAELGLTAVAMLTVGNGGSAWSTYGARAGIKILVGLPAKGGLAAIGSLETKTYGSRDGISWIHHGGIRRLSRLRGGAGRALPVGRREDHRIRDCRPVRLASPDRIVWSTGGRVGLVGLAKAFRELKALHWLDGGPSGLVSAQVGGCSLLVEALEVDERRSCLGHGSNQRPCTQVSCIKTYR